MLTLKRPCAKCPFRTDIDPYLHPERVTEISNALRGGGSFSCHATVDYSDVDEDGDPVSRSPGEQFCAGALILMEKEFATRGGCMANQMVRIMGRMDPKFDPDKLDTKAPVFDSFASMKRAMRR